jgi:putative transposase
MAVFEESDDEEGWRQLRRSETSGRPLGSEAWLEARTGRTLKPQKRGPKPKVRCIW